MQIRNYADVKVHIKTEDILKKNVVYKLTFPNGKVYIGQTVQKLRNRLYAHCNEAFNIEDKTFNNPKANAIRKYMTFEVKILYQGEDLDAKEIKYITLFNSTNRNFGYNISEGGSGMSGKLNSRAKPVIIIDLITKEEKEFDTIRLAANYYNIGYTSICDVLSGRRKTFKNKQYVAKYTAKYESTN